MVLSKHQQKVLDPIVCIVSLAYDVSSADISVAEVSNVALICSNEEMNSCHAVLVHSTLRCIAVVKLV